MEITKILRRNLCSTIENWYKNPEKIIREKIRQMTEVTVRN